MPGQLLSQRDIAKHIGKAFSTVSGYVDQFPEFFSHNGEEGLTRRYYPESLVVAEAISELKSQRLPVEEIRELLIQRFHQDAPAQPVERPEQPIEPEVERSMNKSGVSQTGEAAALQAAATQFAGDPLVELELAAEAGPQDADLGMYPAAEISTSSSIERLIERSMDDGARGSAAALAETAAASSADPASDPEWLGNEVTEDDLLEDAKPIPPAEDDLLTELTATVAKQQEQIAALEERVSSILDIQAALVRERDQYHADLAADLLERDKLMVKWVRDLHSQPRKPGGWLRRVWLLSPFGRPRT